MLHSGHVEFLAALHVFLNLFPCASHYEEGNRADNYQYYQHIGEQEFELHSM